MTRNYMEFAVYWLVIIGPLLVGVGLSIWGFSDGNRSHALWFGFAGCVLLLIGLAFQLQLKIWDSAAVKVSVPSVSAETLKQQSTTKADDSTATQQVNIGNVNGGIVNITQQQGGKQSKNLLRALLGTETVIISKPIRVGETPDVTYVIKNFGQLHAFNIKKVFEWKIDSTTNIDNFKPPKFIDDTEVTVMYPGTSANFHPLVNMPPLSQQQFDDINNGTSTLVITALFEYSDSVTKKHVTQERLRYKVNRNAFGPTNTGNYVD